MTDSAGRLERSSVLPSKALGVASSEWSRFSAAPPASAFLIRLLGFSAHSGDSGCPAASAPHPGGAVERNSWGLGPVGL